MSASVVLKDGSPVPQSPRPGGVARPLKSHANLSAERAAADAAAVHQSWIVTPTYKIGANSSIVVECDLAKTPTSVLITPICSDELGGLLSYVCTLASAPKFTAVIESLVGAERSVSLQYLARYD
jgi:hypothetical protein